jgi:hypothetical protein
MVCLGSLQTIITYFMEARKNDAMRLQIRNCERLVEQGEHSGLVEYDR